MNDVVICSHCGSLNTDEAGMAEAQEIDNKTKKLVGEKKSFYLYQCRNCRNYFPRTDIEYRFS